MRTTLNLDDDVAEAARSLAVSENRSIGQIISELARKGLRPSRDLLAEEDGFPVFHVGPDAAPITSDLVQAALEEQ